MSMRDTIRTISARGIGILRRFAGHPGAAAAVEFAVILPLALLVYIGAAEVSDGVMASRRTTSVATTLANLISFQGTTTQSTSTPTPGNAVSSTTLSTCSHHWPRCWPLCRRRHWA